MVGGVFVALGLFVGWGSGAWASHPLWVQVSEKSKVESTYISGHSKAALYSQSLQLAALDPASTWIQGGDLTAYEVALYQPLTLHRLSLGYHALVGHQSFEASYGTANFMTKYQDQLLGVGTSLIYEYPVTDRVWLNTSVGAYYLHMSQSRQMAGYAQIESNRGLVATALGMGYQFSKHFGGEWKLRQFGSAGYQSYMGVIYRWF